MVNFKDILKESIKNNFSKIKTQNEIIFDTTNNNIQKTTIQYLQGLNEEEFTTLYNIYMKPIKNLQTLDYW